MNIKISTIIYKKKFNVFTEEVNKIALSTNDNKIINSMYSMETYTCVTRRIILKTRD